MKDRGKKAFPKAVDTWKGLSHFQQGYLRGGGEEDDEIEIPPG